ncbi:hypothetical protein RXV95_12030 [Novosphingobium sp. ZN18A2]|uniref:hypothetical protein n=1 Tax=Novosphingobium sp. ZN18A2 TaxID=3079861 RepID=UPI0030D4C4E5
MIAAIITGVGHRQSKRARKETKKMGGTPMRPPKSGRIRQMEDCEQPVSNRRVLFLARSTEMTLTAVKFQGLYGIFSLRNEDNGRRRGSDRKNAIIAVSSNAAMARHVRTKATGRRPDPTES